ncbi:ATP-binding protein [Hymenobacter sp. IS2118]|uniref:tetratricopeptide repeat-containing sensor histidine kinase n=1 Tax=Hymenobacter sp. IS2118 TaxID=1505605 RepID=UPI00054E00F5|nr:ATP-binding protein [Hymenobacter sp. IS2118]
MKQLILLLMWWGSTAAAAPFSYQDIRTDSLKKLLITAPLDSNRVMMLTQLAYEYTQTDPLFTISYGRQALQLAQQLRFKSGEGWALVRLGSGFREAGNYPAALQMGQQGLVIAEELHDAKMTARALNALGYLYWEQGNSRPALAYFFRAKAVAEKTQNIALLTRVMGNIGNVYVQLNRLDSALIYSQRGYALDLSQHDLTSEVGDAAMLGNIYAGLGNYTMASRYYRSSIRRATGQRFTFALCRAYLGQARMLEQQAAAVTDSVLYFGQQALAAGQLGQYPKGILQASQFLAAAHAARRDTAAAFRYLTLASTTRDSLFSRTKMAQIQALDVSERLRQQETADRENAAASERRYYWLLAVLASTVPALLLLWRNNRHKQQANRQLNARNAEIASQRDTLSNTITQLHATQAQLVQSEKMAFLGELTAGIAHELQNPLAFVKNFAEVSTVLVDDMGEDGMRPRPRDPNRDLLLAGLKQNLREISEHGQRATTIIADMLARSRHGSAPHVPTDINSLVDEYLRLAYQGLRAKHPSFHAARVKHLEAGLCQVPTVAADLGRVLLNLFTNAFYAVQQRQMLADESYVAEVRVTTRQLASKHIEIRIYDNGLGIPAEVIDKIFQPFFTTKPAHEGTGLGLSISHDIVTQSHGGTLTVDSREGAGTEFIICLPCPPAL